jgi:hypothetical protein
MYSNIIRSRGPLLAAAITIAAAFLAHVEPAKAQLSKGDLILLNRGVELQAMSEWDDYFHLNTYDSLNYSSINWFSTLNPLLMGPPPGVAWSRWVSDPTQMPPQIQQGTPENPYMSQLISLELADELDLDDGPTRTNEINWFNSVRSSFPNTILYINNYAGQVSDSALGDMITQGQPDMICFDEYPFNSVWDTNYPNHIGAPIGGPYTSWMSELRRYRQWGIAGNIPFATYMQTFHSVEDYDQRVYRDPSPSELRFNNFAALAFNAKVLTAFTYNTGATSLFSILPNGYSGDNYTNSLTAEQADANHRAQIFGRTLACLQPIYDLHNQNQVNPPPGPASGDPCACLAQGTTTSIMILEGKYISGGVTNVTSPPISFQADPQQSTNPNNPANLFYTWWESGKNDPYLNGWAVNNLGTNNNNLPGQVIISWFRVLDEQLDGPTYSNEVYMMVVNALTATNGTAADCLQQIKLNFLTGTNITNLDILDPESGAVITTNMPVIGGSGSSTKRQIVLNLNGGDAALFKFHDGAPFVGHVPPGPAQLSARMQGGLPAIGIQGTVLARYQVQSSPSLVNPQWTTVSKLLLTNSPTAFVDTSTYTNNATYYRVVGIP